VALTINSCYKRSVDLDFFSFTFPLLQGSSDTAFAPFWKDSQGLLLLATRHEMIGVLDTRVRVRVLKRLWHGAM
jgi:hypothetical protein